MKFIFHITFLLAVPVFSSGQDISRSDSLTLDKFHSAVWKLKDQADSVAEEIIKYIDGVRDVSSDAHILAVELLGHINSDRVNQYLFKHFQLDLFSAGFLPDAPYYGALANNTSFTSYLFEYSHKTEFNMDQLRFFDFYLDSFMTKEQILALVDSNIKSNKDSVSVANYQALYNLISE